MLLPNEWSTIDQFSGVYRGSGIQSGQLLAVISPDSTLCLEVYVTPRNIGFMSVGMPVRIPEDGRLGDPPAICQRDDDSKIRLTGKNRRYEYV